MIARLFKKDIYRDIEGVVKADNLSDEAVFNEVDEYVVTNEIYQKLEEFFQEYSHTIGVDTSNVGVWISGHFGSGKSHLLKILSYILTNTRQHSDLIGELFLEKIDDVMLQKSIQKALTTPSQTVLFNIDLKSDRRHGNDESAILDVFMKVFNELRGYYPKFGYIAKFESDLDKRGKFTQFKEEFKKLSGESWEVGREAIFLESDNVSKALSRVDDISEESASQLIDKYEENYSLSIEEFAKEVKAYIDLQEPNFRLIFLVDEVGQFIGENTQLMLNLQTIVETLATVCKGQAWVIVTSQSAVDQLVKTNNATQNDFSKILGRFKVKLNLTSQNANEVIQKRLLEKNDDAASDLGAIYTKVQNSLSSIIHFSDRSRQYRNYSSQDDFALVYPFVPYQMDLFQSCISGLSVHGVFQGRHQSTGERSMLDVVQNIAKKLANESVGTIATFDKFFDGISSIIRGDVQTQIQKASEILDPIETQVLKTLFMIKYVKEFTSNVENITTLLIDNIIEVDISELKKSVQNALNTLKDEKYIQKVGETYEYLTDAEQDIEKEIAATQVDQREITQKLVGWIYDDIIKINKIRFSQNRQNYLFTRKLDDVIVKGKEEELSLNIISPINSDEYDEPRLIHKSIGDSGLLLALEGDYEYLQDLQTFVQTEKFIPQKQSGTLSELERDLLYRKASANQKRREKLQEDLRHNLAAAKIYLNGQPLDIATQDIKTKIETAFEELITNIYPYITMLTRVYEEKDIKVTLEQSDDLLTGSDDALSAPEQEIETYINRQKQAHHATTIANLLEKFSTRPYGWYQNAILTLVASMFTKQKIDLKQNATTLTKQEVAKALHNSREFHTLVVPREVIPPQKIKKVKELIVELYPDISFSSVATRELYNETIKHTDSLIKELQNYKNLNYPFNDSFDHIIQTLTPLSKLSEDKFYDEILSMEDALLDCKDDLIDPLMEFMEGDKRKIYDEIRVFLTQNADNLRYIDDDSKDVLQDLLQDEKPFLGSSIQRSKQALSTLQSLLQPLLDSTKEQATQKINAVIKELQSNENFSKVPEPDRHKIIKPKLGLIDAVQSTKSIDTIKQRTSNDAMQEQLQSGLELIYELIPSTEEKIEIKTVQLSKITPKTKRALHDKDEALEFIEKLKENVLNEIENGKHILL